MQRNKFKVVITLTGLIGAFVTLHASGILPREQFPFLDNSSDEVGTSKIEAVDVKGVVKGVDGGININNYSGLSNPSSSQSEKPSYRKDDFTTGSHEPSNKNGDGNIFPESITSEPRARTPESDQESTLRRSKQEDSDVHQTITNGSGNIQTVGNDNRIEHSQDTNSESRIINNPNQYVENGGSSNRYCASNEGTSACGDEPTINVPPETE